MTEPELITDIITRLKAREEIKYIKADAVTKGFSPEKFDMLLEDAHVKMQREADSDPTIRALLGGALLATAGVCFYTEWAGRSVGGGSILGVVSLLAGGRLIYSLIKMWKNKGRF